MNIPVYDDKGERMKGGIIAVVERNPDSGIFKDDEGQFYLVRIGKHAARIISPPITTDRAMAIAEACVSGPPTHCSETLAMNTLAVVLVASMTGQIDFPTD